MTKEHVILLVEDNPDDEVLALRALRQNNILNEVTVAHDGQEALDLLLPQEGCGIIPQVILLDIKLPKVDGIEVLRRIRNNKRTKHLPVVMLTSSKHEQDLLESYSGGCNSYVRKPVDFSEFTEAVRQLGLYWLLINEAPPSLDESDNTAYDI